MLRNRQIAVLGAKEHFGEFAAFGKRYCDPQFNRFSGSLEYKGSTHLDEVVCARARPPSALTHSLGGNS